MRAKTLRAPAIAAVAALAAVAVPTLGSAQSYPYAAHGYGYPAYGASQSYYDPCVRDQRQRQTAGGLIGATIGAIAGSQVASRGRRTEGSLLGGVLGAAVGAGVGGSQAACRPGQAQPYPADYGYEDRDRYGYDDYAYERRDYGYQGRPDYADDYGYRDDRSYGYPVQTTDYGAADGCRLAESRINLPDGRQDVRYVRTCPDASGRYRVVD